MTTIGTAPLPPERPVSARPATPAEALAERIDAVIEDLKVIEAARARLIAAVEALKPSPAATGAGIGALVTAPIEVVKGVGGALGGVVKP